MKKVISVFILSVIFLSLVSASPCLDSIGEIVINADSGYTYRDTANDILFIQIQRLESTTPFEIIGLSFDITKDGEVFTEIWNKDAESLNEGMAKLFEFQGYGRAGLVEVSPIVILNEEETTCLPIASKDFPEYESVECTDSDDGKDYFLKGSATGGREGYPGRILLKDDGTPDIITYEDSCSNDGKVYEIFCGDLGIVKQEWVACPNGCSDGACIKEPSELNDTQEVQDFLYKFSLKVGEETLMLHEKGSPLFLTLSSEPSFRKSTIKIESGSYSDILEFNEQNQYASGLKNNLPEYFDLKFKSGLDKVRIAKVITDYFPCDEKIILEEGEEIRLDFLSSIIDNGGSDWEYVQTSIKEISQDSVTLVFQSGDFKKEMTLKEKELFQLEGIKSYDKLAVSEILYNSKDNGISKIEICEPKDISDREGRTGVKIKTRLPMKSDGQDS